MEILSNNCVVPAFVGREYEGNFQSAVAIGDQIQMLRPIKTVGGTGQSFEPEGLVRTSVPLNIGFWVKYDFMYNSREEAMFLDADKNKNYVKPGIVHMANTIDLLMLQYIAATSPNFVGTPLVRARSFTENGRPCSGPSRSPRITACSAARAAASAASAVTVQKALSVGLSRSMRSSTDRVSSTGDSFFDRMSAASSVAGV